MLVNLGLSLISILKVRDRVSFPVLLVRVGEEVPGRRVPRFPDGHVGRLRGGRAVRPGEVLGVFEVLRTRRAGHQPQAQGHSGQVQASRRFSRRPAQGNLNIGSFYFWLEGYSRRRPRVETSPQVGCTSSVDLRSGIY